MQNDYYKGKADMRDLIMCHIIGLQNDKYWREDSEGYQALQDLLLLVEDRYGAYCAPYKG